MRAQILSAFSVLILSATAFASNPFDSFLGSYTVTQKACYSNGALTQCDDTTEVKVEYDGQSILRVYESFAAGSIGYGIYERNYSDQFGTLRASISGDDQTATWIRTERVRQFAGPEETELDEIRKFSRVEDGIVYTFSHREKNPMSAEWSVLRVFTLKQLRIAMPLDVGKSRVEE